MKKNYDAKKTLFLQSEKRRNFSDKNGFHLFFRKEIL
jgi:hypothetical protein